MKGDKGSFRNKTYGSYRNGEINRELAKEIKIIYMTKRREKYVTENIEFISTCRIIVFYLFILYMIIKRTFFPLIRHQIIKKD